MANKWLILSAAALLLLTSCTDHNPAPPAAAPAQTAPTANPQPTSTDQPRTDPGIGKEQPLPEQKKPQESPAVQEKTKLYVMNPRTYDIVPINKTSTTDKVVLLTFDDGPKNLELNKAMLDTLDKHKAKAIFFLNGYRIKQKPEIVKLLDSRGQTIGNHSWDHIDLKKQSKEKVAEQITEVQKAVQGLTGKAPAFFRPPFGSGSEEVRAKAIEEKMLYMTWSNGSKDWEMTVKNNSPDRVVTNVLEQLRPGSNILMHELPWTAEALDKLLTRLEELGYGFVDPETIEVKM